MRENNKLPPEFKLLDEAIVQRIRVRRTIAVVNRPGDPASRVSRHLLRNTLDDRRIMPSTGNVFADHGRMPDIGSLHIGSGHIPGTGSPLRTPLPPVGFGIRREHDPSGRPDRPKEQRDTSKGFGDRHAGKEKKHIYNEKKDRSYDPLGRSNSRGVPDTSPYSFDNWNSAYPSRDSSKRGLSDHLGASRKPNNGDHHTPKLSQPGAADRSYSSHKPRGEGHDIPSSQKHSFSDTPHGSRKNDRGGQRVPGSSKKNSFSSDRSRKPHSSSSRVPGSSNDEPTPPKSKGTPKCERSSNDSQNTHSNTDHSSDRTPETDENVVTNNDPSDLYDLIGVPRDISSADLNKAWKKKAFGLHPDRTSPEHAAEANRKLQLVNQAYNVLIDDYARLYYDATGKWPPHDVEYVVKKNWDEFQEMKRWVDMKEGKKKDQS